MIFVKLVVGAVLTTVVALSTMCQPNPESKNYPKHKTAKHSKGKKSEKKNQPPATQPTEPPKIGDQVNLDWVSHYDELLSKHGDKLNPPKKPGDRAGIAVQGKYDKISPKVQEDFEKLQQLDRKQ